MSILIQKVVFSGVCVAAFALMSSGCSSVSSDGKEWVPSASEGEPAVQKHALTNTHKMCSAISPGLFRDTIIVDDNWGGFRCQGWAASIGASQYQLGCMSDFGYTWAPCVNGCFPSPNCGWVP